MTMKEKNRLVSIFALELQKHLDFPECSDMSQEHLEGMCKGFVRNTAKLLTSSIKYKQNDASRALKIDVNALKRSFHHKQII